MVIVAYDPNNENVIRQIFVKPENVMTHEAMDAVEQAYTDAEETGEDPIEILENQGYTLADWMGVEVNDS